MEKPIIFAGEKPDDMNYPIGIQTFKGLRAEDYAYVDKTAHIYRLASRELSRLGEATLLGISTSVLDKLRTKVRKTLEQDKNL